MKKAIAMLGIIHDRSKLIDGLEECRAAIAHTKEARGSISLASHIINPATVLSLFKRMSDEVCEIKPSGQ